ncbi:hypothetical protein BMETH_194_3 [methanotrophic bacterial endosymbiont of Bathymodiolus sp.]|nr:hypothetical protein BMETH_194_3 [methanotrophic bacterial endosymbiont of Bathymodiolus sp.]
MLICTLANKLNMPLKASNSCCTRVSSVLVNQAANNRKVKDKSLPNAGKL